MRQLVLPFRRDQALEGIITERYRVAMRNRRSGTKVYLEQVLRKYSEKMGRGLRV